jgi:predicted nucleic acid-binding protein
VTALLFPDNTVLVNFAHINRVDLLARIVGANGRWCATVAGECARSAREPGLGPLDDVPEIFGKPLFPETQAEHNDVRVLRLELAAPGDSPHQHLGEAETLAIMTRRCLAAFFVTDDRGAARLATGFGVRVYTTWDLLRLIHRVKLADPDTLWGYVQTLHSLGRGSPPGVHDRRTFDVWVDG